MVEESIPLELQEERDGRGRNGEKQRQRVGHGAASQPGAVGDCMCEARDEYAGLQFR